MLVLESQNVSTKNQTMSYPRLASMEAINLLSNYERYLGARGMMRV
jgi:hypothetical protein